MINTKYILKSLFLVFVLTSCGGGSKEATRTVEEPLKPSWVTNRPIDNSYYIGIGVANKQQFPMNYAEEAKRSALNELASEIQVNVSSNSMLFSLEDQSGFKDEFRSFTQLRTNASIENFEQVGVYESSTQYWVFYRLSKLKYQQEKQAKIDKAVAASKTFYSEGLSGGNVRQSLQQVIRSLEPISPYLNETMQTDWEGSQVYWGNQVVKKIAELTSKMHLSPVQSSYNITWGQNLQIDPIRFQLKDDASKPINNIPIVLTYSEGYVRPRIVKTDASGLVIVNIDKMRSTKAEQQTSAAIDLQSIYEEGTDNTNEMVVSLLNKLKTAKATSYLRVSAPMVYVDVELTELGKKSNSSNVIKNAVESAFTDQGYTVSSRKSECQLYVEVDLNTQAVGNSNDMYSVSINGAVKVQESATKTEVYSTDIKNLKGVQLDYQKASQKAVERASSELSSNYIPRFHRTFLK